MKRSTPAETYYEHSCQWLSSLNRVNHFTIFRPQKRYQMGEHIVLKITTWKHLDCTVHWFWVFKSQRNIQSIKQNYPQMQSESRLSRKWFCTCVYENYTFLFQITGVNHKSSRKQQLPQKLNTFYFGNKDSHLKLLSRYTLDLNRKYFLQIISNFKESSKIIHTSPVLYFTE